MKKALLGIFSFGVICGLAYYSSFLYTDRYPLKKGDASKSGQQWTEGGRLDPAKAVPTPGADGRETAGWQKAGQNGQAEVMDSVRESSGAGAAEGKSGDPLLETALPPGAVETRPLPENQAESGYSYYLVEEFGYVNIYNADQETIYEFTDIPIGDLPQELQEEICTGKGVVSEQELYDFLENYSS